MHHDILSLVRKKMITREESETYSILTCRSCKAREEFIGAPTMQTLSRGWSSLTLDSQQIGIAVFQWLLCPKCTEEVRTAAGL
jgi:hypothetical protein